MGEPYWAALDLGLGIVGSQRENLYAFRIGWRAGPCASRSRSGIWSAAQALDALRRDRRFKMAEMQLEANVFDFDGEVMDGFFYATADVAYALDDAIERAQEEGLDYSEIVVTGFDPTAEELADPLGRYCPGSGVYDIRDEDAE